MAKSLNRLFFLGLFLLSHSFSLPAQPEAPRYKVEADCSKILGDAAQITDFFGSGGSLYYLSNNVDDPVVQAWRDLGFKQVTFETLHKEEPMDRWIKVSLRRRELQAPASVTELKNSGLDEKGAVQIDFSDYDRYLRTYLDNLGAKPFVYLGNVPRALSSRPGDPDYSIYGPKDLGLWQEFIKKVVEHNVQKFRLKGIHYGVMGEPDHPDSWRGTLKEHIELYAATYRAVKAVDRTAKVGGPAMMNWQKTKRTPNPPFVLKDWIKALADYNAADPGKAVRLDFISWQDYGWSGDKISDGADAVSGFLRENGFDPQTPKMLAGSGWGSWSSDYLDPAQTPFQRASYLLFNIIREFKNPGKRKFYQALYYSFYFNDYWMTPETEKDMQMQRSVALVIIPKQGRYQLTPGYAAFQMAKAMAAGKVVQTSAEKPLEAMAVADEAGQRLVMTVNNHTPELAIVELTVKEIPFNLKEVKARLQSIDEYHSVDGYGLEEGFEIEPVFSGKTAAISIFVKPYGTIQITWKKPEPPKADDDIKPRDKGPGPRGPGPFLH